MPTTLRSNTDRHAPNTRFSPHARSSLHAHSALAGSRCLLPQHNIVDLSAWRFWLGSYCGRSKIEAWGTADPALLGWGSGENLEAPASSPRTDAMQGALVQFSQSGDADAAITLLVQLRPGLVRLARFITARDNLASYEAAQEVRAVFFESLYGHSLDRRPVKIAANLLLDTKNTLSRRGSRSLRTETNSYEDHSTTDIDQQSGIVAHETLRAVVCDLPGTDASKRLTTEVAFRAWVLRQPARAIATDLGLGPQVVDSRLHRLRLAIQQDGSLWNTKKTHPSRLSTPGYSVTYASTE